MCGNWLVASTPSALVHCLPLSSVYRFNDCQFPIVIYNLSGFIRHHFPFVNRFFFTVISFTISILLAYPIVASSFFVARARLIINQHKIEPQNDFNFVCNWYFWPGSIVIWGRFKMVESIGERRFFFLLSGMKNRYSWSNVNLFRRQLINKLNGLPQSCAMVWCQFLLTFSLILVEFLHFATVTLWFATLNLYNFEWIFNQITEYAYFCY